MLMRKYRQNMATLTIPSTPLLETRGLPLDASQMVSASVLRGERLVDMPLFDPKIHLAFQPPKKQFSFTQLGLERPPNAPDVCYTEPFQLFSEEGVRMIRRELLSKHVLDKHLTSWPRAPCIISYHEEVNEAQVTTA